MTQHQLLRIPRGFSVTIGGVLRGCAALLTKPMRSAPPHHKIFFPPLSPLLPRSNFSCKSRALTRRFLDSTLLIIVSARFSPSPSPSHLSPILYLRYAGIGLPPVSTRFLYLCFISANISTIYVLSVPLSIARRCLESAIVQPARL